MRIPSLRRLAAPAGLALLLVAATAVLTVRAADHADSPDTSEGNLDINDLYAFVDGDDVVLAMTVTPLLTPGEQTDDAALNPLGIYEFNLDVERDGTAEAVVQVVAHGPGPDQRVTVLGPAGPEAGPDGRRIVDASRFSGRFGTTFSGNGMRAFAGPRDDPFFINLFGDESLTSVLNAVYGSALGMQVGEDDEQTLAFADPGEDDLAGLNTVAIVVSVPKATLASVLDIPEDGTFHVWATTGARPSVS